MPPKICNINNILKFHIYFYQNYLRLIKNGCMMVPKFSRSTPNYCEVYMLCWANSYCSMQGLNFGAFLNTLFPKYSLVENWRKLRQEVLRFDIIWQKSQDLKQPFKNAQFANKEILRVTSKHSHHNRKWVEDNNLTNNVTQSLRSRTKWQEMICGQRMTIKH